MFVLEVALHSSGPGVSLNVSRSAVTSMSSWAAMGAGVPHQMAASVGYFVVNLGDKDQTFSGNYNTGSQHWSS